MVPINQMKETAAALGVKMAVVDVLPGETNTDAWKRHLREHPHDGNAMIKVFNQPARLTKGNA